MSETLRDLVVSLSLNSENFTRNIRSVQKKIQEAQSSFKLASAGTDFEQTTAGLSAKQETLKRKRYRTALGETDSATIAAKGNLDLVKEEYRQQTAEVKKLAGQQAALQKTTPNAADAFSSARTRPNNARAAVKQTQADLESCNKALKTAKSEWTAAGKALEGFG